MKKSTLLGSMAAFAAACVAHLASMAAKAAKTALSAVAPQPGLAFGYGYQIDDYTAKTTCKGANGKPAYPDGSGIVAKLVHGMFKDDANSKRMNGSVTTLSAAGAQATNGTANIRAQTAGDFHHFGHYAAAGKAAMTA